MADLASYGNYERDIEQALITLKKGSQLIKYSRKGKPKVCPFRISARCVRFSATIAECHIPRQLEAEEDETTLIWYSHGEERNLKLSSVIKIIPGQRTAVFRRFLRPEKDYLSFSLIYNNSNRSLDLICKDQEEVEVWLFGLKALIPSSQPGSRRTKSDALDWGDADSIHSSRPSSSGLEFCSSITQGRISIDSYSSSDVGPVYGNMQPRGSSGDGFRVSVSSAPSSSSHGSGPDDIESLGDVYLWGELWSDGLLNDGFMSSISTKIDVLTPKPLESNVVLDVHQIACGVRHIALVTRQGEIFTWGEESGGRLGHGIEKDFNRPHLVDFLAVTNMDFVSCGEYHTCSVSTSGDLFAWGDGTHNAGLLGQGNDVSHWIPKRVAGPLEGVQVLSVACGTWHSVLVTANGKLFSFGDGTFGVLGHGDRESVTYPREVQHLSGLKTIKVACGMWHTAAIVEVTNPALPGASMSSRKLFTWGDGDKYRLGHGSKETCFLPTCVSSLTDYNFHEIACGHTMTVALTTSGHVFTMGGTAHGQLGNPRADGKAPCLVQDKLVGEFVEEISCGEHHVAVLTSRSEVFTWGKGANGRLGHGDVDDRKSPTLVEALKDRHVKSISCGSNFTASICIHKWVSGADQSVCSGCRQVFGFTKKRHNCYNCGLVICHACSSKKALKAALAPTPGKPHRVCDACYNKLRATGVSKASDFSKKVTVRRHSIDSRERWGEAKSRMLLSPELVKCLEMKSQKIGVKDDSASIVRGVFQGPLIFVPTPPHSPRAPKSNSGSRPASPYRRPSPPHRRPSPPHRRPSPPRGGTPVFSRGVIDSLKKSNDLLSQEVSKLQNQVISLKEKCTIQDGEIQKLQKAVTEKSSKCKASREVMKCISTQLKEIVQNMPLDVRDSESFKAVQAQAETFIEAGEIATYDLQSSLQVESGKRNIQNGIAECIAASVQNQDIDNDSAGVRDLPNDSESTIHIANEPPASDIRESAPNNVTENGARSPESSMIKSHGATEVIEQFEPGVYVTVILLGNGTKLFKRVKFSKRRFDENQAEDWWKANKDRVFRKYAPPQPGAPPPPPSHTPSSSDIDEIDVPPSNDENYGVTSS